MAKVRARVYKTLFIFVIARYLGFEVMMNIVTLRVLSLKGLVYLEYTDFGSKTNAGGLKHLKVDNKCKSI